MNTTQNRLTRSRAGWAALAAATTLLTATGCGGDSTETGTASAPAGSPTAGAAAGATPPGPSVELPAEQLTKVPVGTTVTSTEGVELTVVSIIRPFVMHYPNSVSGKPMVYTSNVESQELAVVEIKATNPTTTGYHLGWNDFGLDGEGGSSEPRREMAATMIEKGLTPLEELGQKEFINGATATGHIILRMDKGSSGPLIYSGEAMGVEKFQIKVPLP